MHYDKGLDALARHRPAEAVRSLQAALEDCPPSRSKDLYRICFYLGIALRASGIPQSAIKSWISCQRLNKRGHSRKMLSRFTNCYGMDPQDTSEADDWQAFSSIQTARYLLCKNKRTFSTLAEQDMIRDLIRDTWERAQRSQVPWTASRAARRWRHFEPSESCFRASFCRAADRTGR